MSYGTSIVIDELLDHARIRDALAAAVAAQVPRHPAWADTTISVARQPTETVILFDVMFSPALVKRPGGEAHEPGAPHEDGRYWCLFEVSLTPTSTIITLRSKRYWNRDAWNTATTLLEAAGVTLGGRLRDY